MSKRIYVAFVGLLGVTSVAIAQSAPPTLTHAGFIKSARGKVELQDPLGHVRAANAGDAVTASERVVTGVDGGASLVLRDGTALVVGPSSEMNLQQFSFDSTTQNGNLVISLLQGSMRMISGLIGKVHPESVRVDTQTATIGIRGTDFIVNADPAVR